MSDAKQEAIVVESHASAHHEETLVPDSDERAEEAHGREFDALPKGYYYSPYFLGSFFACGFAFMSAVGGYAMVAPVIPYINADIGPSQNLVWIALAYQLCGCVIFLWAGRLSDIFGRRWFFIIGSALGTIGAILGATAQSVNMVIGAEVFLGTATGFQLSSFWVLSELVPMKFRYAAVSTCYIFSIPTAPLGAKIALSFQNNTSSHWRAIFYFLISINAVSTLCWFLFYHPPTYKMLHTRTAALKLILRLDWIGMILYIGSLFTFLMGLSWGGSVYPWKSGEVIGTMVGGGVMMAVFIVWEIYLPIGHEPFLPLGFFRNFRYQCCAWLTAIGSSVYYAFALIWPQAVATLYADRDASYRATISSITAIGFVLGQIVGGYLVTLSGPKLGCIISFYIAVPIFTAAAYNPLNLDLTMGLILTGCLFTGIMETIAVTSVTFPIKSQKDIGTAGGLGGTIRSFGSTIATAVLSTTLINRLEHTIPANVVPAATKAGISPKNLPTLIAGLSGLTPLSPETVPGLTTESLRTITKAFRVANAQAYRTVFLANLAFAGIGLILVWFIMNNDPKMDNYVAAPLHKVKNLEETQHQYQREQEEKKGIDEKEETSGSGRPTARSEV